MAGTQFEVDERVRKGLRLRRHIDALERETTPAQATRGGLGGILTWTARILTTALIVVLGIDAWLAVGVFADDEPSDVAPSGDQPGEVAPSEPSYEDLEVFDDTGSFGGRITVSNPLDDDVELMIQVDIYDGSLNVGDLLATVSLKPRSTATVELGGLDDSDSVSHTDARVHLSRWPK